MIELTLYNVRKHFGETCVLFDAGFTVYEGDKAGIVGANGSGKSTILKLLSGIETMDVDYRKICEGKGRILLTKGTTMAYLEQMPRYPDSLTVQAILNLAFEELMSLEEQLGVLEAKMAHLEGDALETALNQYSRLQQAYDAKGGYDREEKFSKVCTGLKFDAAFLQKEFAILSGGERTTVMLGKILLESPDILLLDEPTNHLDMESVEWLEKYLKSYRGIVIIVSHDRYFLDNVVTKIIEVENHECETYKGNYSDYVRQKEESMLLQYKNYKEQQMKINSMEKTIKDLRDWALRVDNNKFFRRAVSMQRKLDKIARIDKPVFERQNIRISFKTNDRSSHDIVRINGLSKSYGGRILFKDADLHVTQGERVALIGPNGSGKTTFLKVLLGEVSADGGQAALGASVKAAYLPQSITFANEEDTVMACFRENRYILEGKAREYLAKFLFFGKDPYKKVRHLSGGERVRLKLSMLLFDEIDLLILDEPTNHLDIDAIEALEEALEEFRGALLFISHDRYFINKVCSRIVALEDSSLASYPGNYDDYKTRRSEMCPPAAQPQHGRKQKATKEPAAVGNTGTEADMTRLEATIKALEDEVREIDKSMSAPGMDHSELNRLYCRKEELTSQLDELVEAWLANDVSLTRS